MMEEKIMAEAKELESEQLERVVGGVLDNFPVELLANSGNAEAPDDERSRVNGNLNEGVR